MNTNDRAVEKLLRENRELRAALSTAKGERDAAVAALQRIVDYWPERAMETPEELAEVEACQGCEEWRQRNHPIQNRCEHHVHQKYRYIDQNKFSEGPGQVGALRDIARETLATLEAPHA